MNQKEWFIQWWRSVWILHCVMTVQRNIMSLSSGWQLFQADNDVVLWKKMCHMRWFEVIWPITPKKGGKRWWNCPQPLVQTFERNVFEILNSNYLRTILSPLPLTKLSQTTVHNWNIFFLPHHFCFNENWFSHPEDGGSAFLWHIGRFNHNTVQKLKRWPSSITILQKWSCVAILILLVNVGPHYSYPVWCWRFEQLWLFIFGLFGQNTVQCGRHAPMCQKNLLPPPSV